MRTFKIIGMIPGARRKPGCWKNHLRSWNCSRWRTSLDGPPGRVPGAFDRATAERLTGRSLRDIVQSKSSLSDENIPDDGKEQHRHDERPNGDHACIFGYLGFRLHDSKLPRPAADCIRRISWPWLFLPPGANARRRFSPLSRPSNSSSPSHRVLAVRARQSRFAPGGAIPSSRRRPRSWPRNPTSRAERC
jgi:hypothetical protein